MRTIPLGKPGQSQQSSFTATVKAPNAEASATQRVFKDTWKSDVLLISAFWHRNQQFGK